MAGARETRPPMPAPTAPQPGDRPLRERILDVMALYPEPRSALVPALRLAQDEYGWLSTEAFEAVVERVSAPAIRALLSTLTERERQVLRWRFGVDGEELSLRQIGRRLGMSAERVRQIEGRALVKLRGAALPALGGDRRD
jgi:RNA polymerase sigma factor (sigma-70 family)